MQLIMMLIEKDLLQELRKILKDDKSSDALIIEASLNLLLLIISKQITI